nr:hypothetical protein [Tanacetum cinerariifolium]
MATTIDQQVALDESFVPSKQRLRIGRSNFRLSSDIQSKESTLQVVYDVLWNSPLFRVFQVTADVPEIYMQELRLMETTFFEYRQTNPFVDAVSAIPDDDDNNEEEDIAKDDDEETETGKGGNEVRESEGESDDKETTQEEEGSFDPIPRTPESEDESNDEEDQELRLSEEDGPQESSSMSLFMTSMLNPTSDVGVESIFTTAYSPIVSLPTPTPIMTPSTISTITTSSEAPIPPPTIPSIILENLSTFNSAYRFEERLRSLETSFSEYRQTNPFVDATDRLQDSLQRENDEFLRNIDENMKKIIKGQVKNQVKEQVSRILPRIEESVNATLEAEVLSRSSHSSRTSYAIAALVEAYDADKAILDTDGDSTILKRRREDDDQEGPSAGSKWGSKRQKEGGEHASASTPSEIAIEGAGGSTTGSQSRQLSASKSDFAEEPVKTTCQMEEPPHPVFETGADDQPIVQTSQHPEWFSQPKRPPSPDRAWNTTLPAAQGDAQSWISDLASLTELEYHLEEVYKATTDQLD